MVELNVVPAAVDTDDLTQKTAMDEVNAALTSCSLGLFHLRLLITSFFAFTTSVLIGNTTSYILPNAECDLNMGLMEKGILNATPSIGMLCSSLVAGFLTDTFGRKFFLVYGFGGIALFTMYSAMSQTYGMLVAGKFFEGILFATAISSSVTFTSEFCHPGNRDLIMMLQSSFRSLGSVVVALISWGILVNEWRFSLFDEAFVLYTWNFYLLMASLFPLTACIFYCFLPESPKYLVTQNKYEEAKKTLCKIYMQNTGKSADTFPQKNIFQSNKPRKTDESQASLENRNIVRRIAVGLENCKPMFRKPLGLKLLLLCTMYFLVTSLYSIVRLWFPQLSTIVEHYYDRGDLCQMLDAYIEDWNVKKSVNLTEGEVCVPTKTGTETYINSVILGCICCIPFIATGFLLNSVGKKSLQIVASTITIFSTFGLKWASKKTQVVALFATDMAIGQTMMGILQAFVVENFPTKMRTLAISMLMMSGRTGTLIANVMFPILLAKGCIVPFFTLASLMICLTFFGFLLPKKTKLATTKMTIKHEIVR